MDISIARQHLFLQRGGGVCPCDLAPCYIHVHRRTDSGCFVSRPLSCRIPEQMPPRGKTLWLLTGVWVAPMLG
jgi:hypothetical protein